MRHNSFLDGLEDIERMVQELSLEELYDAVLEADQYTHDLVRLAGLPPFLADNRWHLMLAEKAFRQQSKYEVAICLQYFAEMTRDFEVLMRKPLLRHLRDLLVHRSSQLLLDRIECAMAAAEEALEEMESGP